MSYTTRCYCCGQSGHISKFCMAQKEILPINCYICKGTGHRAKQCPTPKLSTNSKFKKKDKDKDKELTHNPQECTIKRYNKQIVNQQQKYQLTCYICLGYNHFPRQCPHRIERYNID